MLQLLSIAIGICTALVPLLVVLGSIHAVDYRISGSHRADTLRVAGAALAMSLLWSASLATFLGLGHLWAMDVHPSHAALLAVPVIVGVGPAGVLLLLGFAPSSGSPDRRPLWRVWAEHY